MTTTAAPKKNQKQMVAERFQAHQLKLKAEQAARAKRAKSFTSDQPEPRDAKGNPVKEHRANTVPFSPVVKPDKVRLAMKVQRLAAAKKKAV